MPCWHYVGTFFALGRFFFALGRLLGACWAFDAHVGRFFCVLGRSKSDFAASGTDFGRPETSFFDVFSRTQACNAKKLWMFKNHSFSQLKKHRNFEVNFRKVPVAAVPLTEVCADNASRYAMRQKHNKNKGILHAFFVLDGALGG